MNLKNFIQSPSLWAIFACIIWGTAFAIAVVGFEYMPPLLLSGMRFTLAGLMLLPLLLIRRETIGKTIRKNWRFMTLFAFVQSFAQYGIYFWALDKVSPVYAAIVMGAGPLVVAVMAHFMLAGDKLSKRKLAAILLAMIGVTIISIDEIGGSDGSSSFYLGMAGLILTCLIGGYTNIMVAKYERPLSPILLTAYANFTGGLMLLAVGFIAEDLPTTPPSKEFIAIWLWLSFIPAAAFSIWYTLLQREDVKVSEINMWKFVIPITGCLLSWLLLEDEKVELHSLLGISLITIALLIFQSKKKN